MQHRNPRSGRLRLQPPAYFEAVYVRQVDVEQHQVGLLRRGHSQGLGAGARLLDEKSFMFQDARDRVPAAFVVVDVEDGRPGVFVVIECLPMLRPGLRRRWAISRLDRHPNPLAAIRLGKHLFGEHGSSLGRQYSNLLLRSAPWRS